jgi:uncharacterized membrane protein YgdD (TMEM256/DUF423 family)
MTASRIHIFLAALMGAAGVALWAMAAHKPGAASLVTAAHFLLFHAAAVIGTTACRKEGLIAERLASLSIAILILGTLLFSGDLVMRSFLQAPLFANAAPIGGTITILGWVLLAVAAVMPKKNDMIEH